MKTPLGCVSKGESETVLRKQDAAELHLYSFFAASFA